MDKFKRISAFNFYCCEFLKCIIECAPVRDINNEPFISKCNNRMKEVVNPNLIPSQICIESINLQSLGVSPDFKHKPAIPFTVSELCEKLKKQWIFHETRYWVNINRINLSVFQFGWGGPYYLNIFNLCPPCQCNLVTLPCQTLQHLIPKISELMVLGAEYALVLHNAQVLNNTL